MGEGNVKTSLPCRRSQLRQNRPEGPFHSVVRSRLLIESIGHQSRGRGNGKDGTRLQHRLQRVAETLEVATLSEVRLMSGIL